MLLLKKPTRLDYCQYLLSSQINYTLTDFADHSRHFTHDQLNRFLKDEKMTPRLIWEQTKEQIIFSPNDYLIFDDTVSDKNYSLVMELVRRQWSGNAKSVIKGIGIVTCIYVNLELNKFWLIDYRIFAPDEDGKTKLDHAKEMFDLAVHQKRLPFRIVLMDTWYATRRFTLHIERTGKIYYCPVQNNRQADESDGSVINYRRAGVLSWDSEEELSGKNVHLKDFPKGHRVQLFRLAVSKDRADYIVTNNLTQNSTAETQKVCAVRWKIEQLHREVKQISGLESCQCRKSRIQHNHIACATLVWCRFKELAYETGETVYQIKFSQMKDYLIQQLKSPSVKMAFA
jgi:DDE superfamily endonuclease